MTPESAAEPSNAAGAPPAGIGLGSIVRLKSGGPPMTVAGYNLQYQEAYCRYFWRGRQGDATFSFELLEPAQPWQSEGIIAPPNSGRSARQDSPDDKKLPGVVRDARDAGMATRAARQKIAEAKKSRKPRAMRETENDAADAPPTDE